MSTRPKPTRRLPEHPNLEQLRKQAKDLLAQYRDADPVATAEVQQFERKPDPEPKNHVCSRRGQTVFRAGPQWIL